MKFRILLLASALFLLQNLANAQTGGDHTYAFLDLNASARIAAVGGNLITVKDDDLNIFSQNPAVLNSSMDNQIALNYVNYFAGINYGFAAYGRHYKNIGTFAAGMQYVNYGTFTQADETGQVLGEFTAGEYALNLAYAKPFGQDSVFSIGGNLKTIYSAFETYSSFGLALDIGGTYYNKEKEFTASVVFRNLGFQLKSYVSGNREPLPIDIQVGISKKLQHMPFRFSIVAHHLHQPDMSYQDPALAGPQIDPLTGEEIEEKKRIGDKIMRHFIVGGELFPDKRINIRFGYNYHRRQELKVESRPATVGFSYGVGVRISKFHLSYGRAAYHLAGPSHHISISTNLNEFYTKE